MLLHRQHDTAVSLDSKRDAGRPSSISDIVASFESPPEPPDPRPLGRRTRGAIRKLSESDKMSDETDGNPPVANTRNSLKHIKPNIVQRRTVLFEQGEVVCKEDDVDVKPKPSARPAIKPVKPVAASRPPVSPKKVAKVPSLEGSDTRSHIVLRQVSSDGGAQDGVKSPVVRKFSYEDGTQGERSRPVLLRKQPSDGVMQGSPGLLVSEETPKARPQSVSARARLFESQSEGADTKCDPAVRDLKKPPPKPARPPKPHLKVDIGADEANSVSKVMPPYAKVNKVAKANAKKDSPPIGPTTQYDGVVTLSIDPSTAHDASSPPIKPPRTFAHDLYLQKKAAKRKSRTSCPSPVKEMENNHVYEEVETKNGIPVDPAKTPTPENINTLHQYEEIADMRQQVERQNSIEKAIARGPLRSSRDRPTQPPPRPPQPTKCRWEDPKVCVKKHNKDLTNDCFVQKRNIHNPGYAKRHEHIPIKTFVDGSGTLKRYKSDEYLYADPNNLTPKDHFPYEEPVYQDPVDMLYNRRGSSQRTRMPHGVSLDEEGYAIPDHARHSYGREVSI